MTTDYGRDPTGQALVASDQAASRLAPSGFDPSRLIDALASFSPDVVAVLDALGDGEQCDSAEYAATELRIPAKRIREVRRALRVLGLAECGPLCDVDAAAYAPRGSGYWITDNGDRMRDGIASAIEARRAAATKIDAVADESAASEAGDAR